ncbi:MAG: molybdopterin molybdenumtransferase MoeA [Micavibrio sp.]|nr:MAG: molybdopterin molybdenumtransferase MoeA [Micavibrio sp.]
MISYEQAKAIVLQAGRGRKPEGEQVITKDLVGRVCAQDLRAPIDIQPFDNSAMDGFAVRIGDLGNNGGVLNRVSMVAAGDSVPDEPLHAGECTEIMTGAPVPPGTEAVVPVELVEVNDDQVRFKVQPEMGANIRRAGEDFKKGMDVLRAGQVIYPQHIMPLAALGIDKVEVYKKPRAVFMATGNELVEDLSQDLKPGQIYNSNLPYGLAALEAMGVECSVASSVPDDPDQFEKLLTNFATQEIDFIISSGAVSAGKFDFVREGLEKAGAEILFHKVNIKPGKPNLFARLPNGTLYFGLPGNPVATAAGLRFFVQPCIRAMMGMGEEKPVSAKATTPFKKRDGLRVFLKARAESGEGGALVVDLLDGQASFMVSPFLGMNCWAVAPEGVEEIKVDDIVDLYPLYPQAGLV